jgi:hypothetical protein
MAMSADPPYNDPSDPAPELPFDPVIERERILALVRGRKLDAFEAEWVCATLTMLAEM